MSKIKKRVLIVFIVFITIIGLIFLISNNLLTVEQQNLEYSNLPKEFNDFKIVHLSDLHSKKFGKDNNKLIKKIKEQNPDIVVMTGDMIDRNDNSIDVFLSLAKTLGEEQYDAYYIVGNHEQSKFLNNLDTFYKQLKDLNIRVLDNEKEIIEKDGASIDIYGLWYNLRFYSDQTDEYIKNNPDTYTFGIPKMEELIGEKDENNFSLLLAHNPAYFETYVDWGADLTLSGHVHGGVVRIPFVGGVFSPDITFFPKYDAGKFTLNDDKNMIVSRGLGNTIAPLRFLNCPQFIVITLNRK